jgi:hypothetical protein
VTTQKKHKKWSWPASILMTRSTQRLTIRYHLCNHSPFVRNSRRDRLGVQQKGLCSSCSRPITPGREEAVAGHNASGEVRGIVEGR